MAAKANAKLIGDEWRKEEFLISFLILFFANYKE